MLPSLSVPDAIKVLRSRYPAALVCAVCALLLATMAASYAKSGLTDEQRLAYVCAECRLDLAEAERVKAIRAEIGRQNIVHARAARAARKAAEASDGHMPDLTSRDTVTAPDNPRACRDGFSLQPGLANAQRRLGRPGRPRISAVEQSRKARERVRAYRARRKAVL